MLNGLVLPDGRGAWGFGWFWEIEDSTMTDSTIIPQQHTLFRSILAVVAGAVAAIALIMVVQQLSALVRGALTVESRDGKNFS